jgi:SLBB domain
VLKFAVSIFIIILAFKICDAQVKNSQLGSSDLGARTSQNAFFDYSDPQALNIKISVLGAVRYPGKYLVPNYTTVLDLLSYAGGPDGNAEMDELKLYRISENGKEKLIDFSYDDVVNGDKLEEKNRIVPKLEPGDFLIVPSNSGTSFREYLNIGLSLVSVIISIVSIVVYSRR